MTRKQKISFETHGTSLLTRMRSTLDPEYFALDERSMSDLMVFILEFSKKVQYTNYNNKIEGDWAPFFENNLAFLLAKISCADTEHFNSRFKRAVSQIESEIDSENKKSNLRELIKYTFDLFEKYIGFTNAFEMLFPQIDKVYPGSKFIHTVRDKDSWLMSIEAHLKNRLARPEHHLITFGSYRFNKDRFSFVYEMHLDMVNNYFTNRKTDLLTIDSSERLND